VSTDPLRRLSTRATPQSRRADPRQVPNNAGGYAFVADPVQRLRRFLVLGVEGGTYHVVERELAVANCEAALELAASDHAALLATVVDVSEAGSAPRPQPALFALALACSNGTADERRAAFAALPRVARTPTHLFTFLNYLRQFRGWSKAVNRGVSNWYLAKPLDRLAYQTVKYREREGWRHRDVLRLAHPKTTGARDALFGWLTHPDRDRLDIATRDDELRIVNGFERLRRQRSGSREVPGLIRDYGLPWEAVPDEHLNRPEVWEALLDAGLPQTALLRQLPRLTRLGLVTPLGPWTARVVNQLADVDRLRAARVHPLQVLVAQRTYASGRSDKGTSTWTPSRPVVDGLDAAFYAAFGAVPTTGRRLLLALDTSGSMTTSLIAKTPLTPREASAALALVTLAVEPNVEVIGFTGAGPAHPYHRSYRETPAVSPLDLSPRRRLDDVVRYVNGLTFGRTDCALPMLYALERGLEVDAFVIYTDSESWAGAVHPHEALRRYRERVNPAARLVVVGMTATELTVADPADSLSLDVVGFDTATPQLLADFAAGGV
jgi:60 kDa SS-A/Ro ribonucleoprotein